MTVPPSLPRSMAAAVLPAPGAAVVVAEVPVPRPGPGEVLVRVRAAGVCHSDVSLRDGAPGFPPLPRFPWVLGHEVAGVVAATGPGVAIAVGTPVAVWPGWGDGTCAACRIGREHSCAARAHAGSGSPGGWAHYMLVPAERHLVPTEDLAPCAASVCTDAGLTSYSAVRKVLPELACGGTAVVIGAGGVGQWAVAHLRALDDVTVVALDPVAKRRRAAAAHLAVDPADPDVEAVIRTSTPEGVGASAVLDVVGSAETLTRAARLVAPGGRIVVVGMGGGTLPVGFGVLPVDAAIGTSGLGSPAELAEVLRATRRSGCPLDLDIRPLGAADAALSDLTAGRVRGRVVLTPA